MALNTRLRKTVLAVALAVPGAILPMQAAQAQIAIGVSINIAPPELPVYEQPPLPAPGYLWTPGYWAYGDAGYFWVPGVWVQPPTVGLLWTPGYWGYDGGAYGFHEGYWGPHVGFYGGVNYGFGFGGIGFVGGEWRGNEFAYNSAAANFGNVHVTNVYNNTTIIEQNTVARNHTSFNGPGGIAAQPTAQEQQFAHEQHVPPTGNQVEVQKAASQDRAQLAAVNHGKPATPAAPNNEAYRQVAAEHAKTQPITTADRAPVAAKGGAAAPAARPAAEARPAAAEARPAPAGARPTPAAAAQVARPPSGQGALDRAAHTEAPAERAESAAQPRAAAAPRPAPARPAPVARPATAAVEKDVPAERPAAAAAPAPRAPAVHAEAPRPEAARPEAPRPAAHEEKEKEKP